MKAAPFDHVAPTTIADACTALAEPDAVALAGGQSLIPLLALRLARPTVLVDLAGLGLDHVEVDPDAGVVRIGALVRHRRLELDPVVARAAPLLAEAAALIGYPAIRNRGTIGGSLAHADPVAELPAVLVATGGSVLATGPAAERVIPASDLFDGFFTTSLEPNEVLTEVHLPWRGPGRHGAAFCEWAPRVGDFATAGVALTLEVDDAGRCTAVGAAACGVASVPVDLGAVVATAGVVGATRPVPELLRAVAAAVTGACAGDDDRAELTGLLAARALRRAFDRADQPAAEVAA